MKYLYAQRMLQAEIVDKHLHEATSSNIWTVQLSQLDVGTTRSWNTEEENLQCPSKE